MAWNEIRHHAKLIRCYGEVPYVEGNEARLGQVFLNLLINAAQALPEGQAERNEIRVATRLEGAQVIIEVSDTGPGIAPHVIGRIFDAFFTTKAVGAGTGLGLAISQRIVADMGGEITVTSELGKGTTFRVALSVSTLEARANGAVAKPMADVGRRGHVLIVDDEVLVLRSIQRALAKEHDLTLTTSATEALKLCESGKKFDLILCDLMMPDMTGMDLHRNLAIVAPDQAERMLFLTGGAFTFDARQFLSSPPKEHLEKPFDQLNLRAIANRYVR